jgi:hypothetical protein
MAVQNSLSEVGDVSEKGLYAISALVSSNHEGQRQFYRAGGVATIRRLLEADISTRQLRRALNLVTDLTDVEGDVEVSSPLPLLNPVIHLTDAQWGCLRLHPHPPPHISPLKTGQ